MPTQVVTIAFPSTSSVDCHSLLPMHSPLDIQDWLSNLPGRPEPPPHGAVPTKSLTEPNNRKRRYDQVLTPPGSDHNPQDSENEVSRASIASDRPVDPMDGSNQVGLSTPIRKRPRPIPDFDPDQTPRAVQPSDSASQAGSTVSKNSKKSKSSSAVSHRSKSPTKQLGVIEISKNSIRVLSLDSIKRSDDFNSRADLQSLQMTINAITRFKRGEGTIPSNHKDKIVALNLDIDLPEYSLYDPEEKKQERFGPVPTFEQVYKVCMDSQYGIGEHFDESSWDREVHLRILELAIREPSAPMRIGLINFTPSTTAAIHPALIKEMKDIPPRMVDFCIYVNPTSFGMPELDVAVKETRDISGFASVNHTDLFHLRDKPISLSVESKQRSAGLDDAQLQIATWHTAQWAYLEHLARKRAVTLDGLPFLPGLIVQAEDWHFVASTRHKTATTLWSKKTIGSTSDLGETYQVVRAIQYLAWWTKYVYWPWFSTTILDVEVPPASRDS